MLALSEAPCGGKRSRDGPARTWDGGRGRLGKIGRGRRLGPRSGLRVRQLDVGGRGGDHGRRVAVALADPFRGRGTEEVGGDRREDKVDEDARVQDAEDAVKPAVVAVVVLVGPRIVVFVALLVDHLVEAAVRDGNTRNSEDVEERQHHQEDGRAVPAPLAGAATEPRRVRDET